MTYLQPNGVNDQMNGAGRSVDGQPSRQQVSMNTVRWGGLTAVIVILLFAHNCRVIARKYDNGTVYYDVDSRSTIRTETTGEGLLGSDKRDSTEVMALNDGIGNSTVTKKTESGIVPGGAILQALLVNYL